jgi:hypothetical protein
MTQPRGMRDLFGHFDIGDGRRRITGTTAVQ